MKTLELWRLLRRHKEWILVFPRDPFLNDCALHVPTGTEMYLSLSVRARDSRSNREVWVADTFGWMWFHTFTCRRLLRKLRSRYAPKPAPWDPI